MANTLVDVSELAPFPGAPFDETLVDIAVASIRAEAGWHIAPVETHTLTIDTFDCGGLLVLPTLRLVEVTAVRDVTTTETEITGWSPRARGLWYPYGWPVGVLEVDIEHGYDETPLELLPIVAARVRQATDPRDPTLSQRSITKGPFTEAESYRTDSASVVDPVIARYSVRIGLA